MNRFNKKDIRHGYWEWRYLNGKVGCKFTLNNGMYLGYREWYLENGETHRKEISI